MPTEVPESIFRAVFSSYEAVSAFTRETYTSHRTVQTGVINLLMTLEQEIPAVLCFGKFTVRVSYRSQARQCRTCTRTDHHTDKCASTTCGKKGHSAESCLLMHAPATSIPPAVGPPPPTPPPVSLPPQSSSSSGETTPVEKLFVSSTTSISPLRLVTRPAPVPAPKKGFSDPYSAVDPLPLDPGPEGT